VLEGDVKIYYLIPVIAILLVIGAKNLMIVITGGLREGAITGGFGLPTEVDHPLMNKYRAAAKKYASEERFGVFYAAGIMFAEPLVEALKGVGPIYLKFPGYRAGHQLVFASLSGSRFHSDS